MQGDGAARGRILSATGSCTQLSMALDQPGVHRLSASDKEGRFRCVSNPIKCAEGQQGIFWGDIHAQSAIGCGAQTIEAYFRFARDFASCRFFASPQAHCSGFEPGVARDLRCQPPVSTTVGISSPCLRRMVRQYVRRGDHNSPPRAIRQRQGLHFTTCVADLSDVATTAHVTDLHAHYRARIPGGGARRRPNLNLAFTSRPQRLLEVPSTTLLPNGSCSRPPPRLSGWRHWAAVTALDCRPQPATPAQMRCAISEAVAGALCCPAFADPLLYP